MESTDIEKYSAHMTQIKLRVALINITLGVQPTEIDQLPIFIESIGLQFRKVFELIAFATLAANRAMYSLVYRDFAKHWEAGKLLKNLEKINPEFYPKPGIETPSEQPGVRAHFNDRPQDYLTKTDLIAAHGRCGGLLHAANPFAPPINYEFYLSSFPVWAAKIVNLLHVHRVHLVGDSGFYHFHMKEQGHDEVRHYRFELHRETATTKFYKNQTSQPE
jgi:hypothetical protein